MAIYKLHTFFLPVYRELLPDDWKGEDDPRAPRMLFRGPTVAEFAAMFASEQALPKTAQEAMAQNDDVVALLSPLVKRFAGDWTLAGVDGKAQSDLSLRDLSSLQMSDLFVMVLSAGRPDEEKDLVPLGAGGQPA